MIFFCKTFLRAPPVCNSFLANCLGFNTTEWLAKLWMVWKEVLEVAKA
jgi:hypothetical protein